MKEEIADLKKSWERIDRGEIDIHWDIYWCELMFSINQAEVEQLISSEQAWYLREKYLRKLPLCNLTYQHSNVSIGLQTFCEVS